MTLYVHHVTPGHISQPCVFAILLLLIVANWKVMFGFTYDGIKVTWLDLKVDIHKRTHLRQVFVLRKEVYTLGAGLSSRRPRLDPGAVHVSCVADVVSGTDFSSISVLPFQYHSASTLCSFTNLSLTINHR